METHPVICERCKTLESALRQIAEHPHCQSDLPDPICHCDAVLYDYMINHGMSEWAIGCVNGHRCAAEIARKTLEGK